ISASRDGLLSQITGHAIPRRHIQLSSSVAFARFFIPFYHLPSYHAERRRSRQGSGWPRSWKRLPWRWSPWWSRTWRRPRSRSRFCTSRTGRGCHLHAPFLPNSCLVSIFAEGQPAVVDPRLANSAEDRLILSFKSLSLRQDAMPPRPDFGTKGRYPITSSPSHSISCAFRKVNQAPHQFLPHLRSKGSSLRI